MKFVFFGYDMTLSNAVRLLDDGHELCGVFSFQTDNVYNFNGETLELAETLGVPAQVLPVQAEDIARYLDEGVELFVSVGYPHKIPHIDESKARGINIHPALLPQARGIMPAPYILTEAPDAAGVTAHKITDQVDGGDILKRIPLQISDQESVEMLSAKIAMRTPDMLSDIVQNLDAYWCDAQPQNEGDAHYFPPPSQEMRTLNWTAPVAEIAKTARAFGRYGSIAHIEDQTWLVYDLDVWEEVHDLPVGSIACLLPREIIIAAKDGFVCLKDLQRAQQEDPA